MSTESKGEVLEIRLRPGQTVMLNPADITQKYIRVYARFPQDNPQLLGRLFGFLITIFVGLPAVAAVALALVWVIGLLLAQIGAVGSC